MKRIAVVILSAVLAMLSLAACKNEMAQTGISKTTNATTGISFEEWTEMNGSTAAIQPTTKTGTPTSHTGNVTISSGTETTAGQITTSLSAGKTTRTATQKELKLLYDMAYNKVMADYYQYQIEQRSYIAELEADIADLKEQASDLYTGYKQQELALKERYAAMGLLNSGAHKAAVKNLEAQYKSNLAPISKEIDELEKELKQAKADYAVSEKQLDAIIQAEYLAAVEEFQQKTLS